MHATRARVYRVASHRRPAGVIKVTQEKEDIIVLYAGCV